MLDVLFVFLVFLPAFSGKLNVSFNLIGCTLFKDNSVLYASLDGVTLKLLKERLLTNRDFNFRVFKHAFYALHMDISILPLITSKS